MSYGGLNGLEGDEAELDNMILAPVNLCDSRVLIGKPVDPKIAPMGSGEGNNEQ